MTRSRLISSEECQREEAQIYLEIGRAISEWSLVEEWLSLIYSLSVYEFAFGGPLHASFNSLNSVQLKLKMIREALNHVRTLGVPDSFNPSHIARAKQWSSRRTGLQKIIENHNDNRNKLAHGPLIYPEGIGPEGALSLPVWVPSFDRIRFQQVRVHRFATYAKNDYSQWRWSSADIANIRQGFVEARTLLSEFYSTFGSGP